MENDVIIYNNGEIELDVSVDSETVWLRADDIAFLFDVQRPGIVKHIGKIYQSKELDDIVTCSILEQVTKDGKKRKVKYYNLDMIISLGYRVNSFRATQFRQWANKILKQYITNRYVINSEKITHDRFVSLENKVEQIGLNLNSIDNLISSKKLTLDQGDYFHA
jgi:hypothetical protein